MTMAMRPALRRAWLRLHRWVGLSLGLVLAAVALTGALLMPPSVHRARASASDTPRHGSFLS